MKSILRLSIAALALAAAQSALAQVSSTDRLAVDSGVSLWRNAWKSTDNADIAKLQPLYRANVVTRSFSGDAVKQTWADFVKVARERGAQLQTLVVGQASDPTITVDKGRLVTSFPSGIQLVWEKFNGIWQIVDQRLPEGIAPRTAAAD